MNDAREVAETVARAFHEAYERLAPSFGYETRPESSVAWDDVPEPNRSLMVAAVRDALAALSEAGLTVCGERVGTAHKNGGYFGGWTLEASLMNESGRPVFIESEEPK